MFHLILQKVLTATFTKRIYKKSVKKGISSFFLMVCLVNSVQADVNNSYFAASNATYTQVFDGVVLGNTSNDNVPFQNIDLGFPFKYNGIDYQIISISPNGYISFNNSNSQSTKPLSQLTNVVSALGGDLKAKSNSTLRYKLHGTAPNRIFIIQWQEYRPQTGTYDRFNFQIRLHETSNNIEFAYGDFFIDWMKEILVEVGLKGATNNDFSNRTTYSDWSNTTAGVTNNATCAISNWVGFPPVVPRNGLTFIYDQSAEILPIQLANFKGELYDGEVLLKWETLTEFNNDYFEVERSDDGISFYQVGEVDGSGNSNSLNKYSFNDYNAFGNKFYYRLKQVDFDGKSSYSNIIWVEVVNFTNPFSLEIFPNPSKSDNISFKVNTLDISKSAVVQLFTIEGKLLFNKTYSNNDLRFVITISELPGLKPKTYYLKVQQGEFLSIKPLIIVD